MFGMNSMLGYGSSIYGMAMPNYAEMNNIKLMLGMQKSSASSSASAGGSSVSSKNYPALDTDTKEFLNSYQNNMSDLLTKANALRGDNAAGAMGSLAATSSDSEILTAKAKYRITEPANYTVDVGQLATAQRNVSSKLDSTANDTLSGSLSIRTGSKAVNIDVGSVTGKNNHEKLLKIADEINGFKAGVEARVVNKEGQSHLEITSQETGAANAFSVGGSFASQTGLDTAEQAARDARYTVDDGKNAVTYTSASNDVRIGSYKIEATLKKEGQAQVRVGIDNNTTASALGDLVKSYNKTVSFLKENLSDRGAGVAQQLRRMLTPVSEKTMARIGITRKTDGTLAFDKDAFLKAADKDPSLVNDLVGGSYGFATKIYDGAKAGLGISSSRLTGQSATAGRYSGASYQQLQNSRAYDPLNLMSTYNRQGIANVMDYNSIGLLMNINI